MYLWVFIFLYKIDMRKFVIHSFRSRFANERNLLSPPKQVKNNVMNESEIHRITVQDKCIL